MTNSTAEIVPHRFMTDEPLTPFYEMPEKELYNMATAITMDAKPSNQGLPPGHRLSISPFDLRTRSRLNETLISQSSTCRERMLRY